MRTWIGEVKLDRLSARLKIFFATVSSTRTARTRSDSTGTAIGIVMVGMPITLTDDKFGARDGKQERARAIGVVEQFDGITVQDVAIFVTNELGIAVL